MDALLISLLCFFFSLILIGIVLQILFFIALFHCLLAEKDYTKKIFWIIAICIVSFGGLLYFLVRIYRRRRRQRDPDYKSSFEEEIMSFIFRRKSPKKKDLLKKGRNPGRGFLILGVVLISSIIFLIAGMGIALPNLVENEYNFLWIAGVLLVFILMIIASLFFDPRRGWNRYIATGISKKGYEKFIEGKEYVKNGDGFYREIANGKGIHIHVFDVASVIEELMKRYGIQGDPKRSVLILACFGPKNWGERIRMMDRNIFNVKSFTLDGFLLIREHFKDLKCKEVFEITFDDKEVIKEDRLG